MKDGGGDDLARKNVVADFVDPLTKSVLFLANVLDLSEDGLEVVKDVATDVVNIQKK
jgi:hypothetical protein